jgi:hypothetical protein
LSRHLEASSRSPASPQCGSYGSSQEVGAASSAATLNAILSAWSATNCDGGVITFKNLGVEFTLTSEYIFGSAANITLDASKLINPVTLYAKASSRHFTVQGVAGLTARNIIFAASPSGAAAVQQGGSVLIAGSAAVTLSDCRFIGHTIRSSGLAQGGALAILNTAAVRLDSVLFEGNAVYAPSGFAADGGAIYRGGGRLVMRACQFVRNTAHGYPGEGAGLHSDGPGSITVASPNFTANFASHAGGGIYQSSVSSMALTQGLFDRNKNRIGDDDIFNQGIISSCSLAAASTVVLESSGTASCPVRSTQTSSSSV